MRLVKDCVRCGVEIAATLSQREFCADCKRDVGREAMAFASVLLPDEHEPPGFTTDDDFGR